MDSYTSPYSYSGSTSTDMRERSTSPAPLSTAQVSSYRPSAATQLILNRVALGRSSLPNPPPTYHRGYPPMGPPPRMMPRYPPAYYDYDYGYGGYYYYPPPPPRMSRYDNYLDDSEVYNTPYVPSYRPRVVDMDDTELRDKSVPHVTTTTSTTTIPRTTSYTRPYSPGMLQDHVDKMRIRLKSLAYSLDPTGPVPEIILPERTKKAVGAATDDKKYSSGPKHLACVEFAGGQPQWKRRARARYPSDDPDHITAICKAEYLDGDRENRPEKEKEKLILKDRLSNRIHQFFNSTLSPEQFDRYLKSYREPGQPVPTKSTMLPDSASRLSKYSSSKWEEPDTVFGGPSDRKPYSKAITDGTTEEASEEKKERRKKKKSKERELAAEAAPLATESAPSAALVADVSNSEVEAVSAPSESNDISLDAIDDEKERKKQEKKKRKAEREAAAKAAMEAELAALAAAEAELARLEAESSKPEAPAPEAAPEPAPEPAPAEVAAEVKSESAAEKCESSGKVVSEGVCVTPDPAPPVPLQAPPQVPPQVPEEPKAPEPSQEPQPEPPVQEPVAEPPVEDLLVYEPPPLTETQVEVVQEEPKVEPPVEETPVEEPPKEEPKVEIPPVEEPPVAEPPVAEPPVVEPPVAEPQVEEPQVEEPQVEELKVEEPQIELPVEEPKLESPLEEPKAQVEPPVEESTVEEPLAEEAPVKPPVEEAPVVEPEEAPPVEAVVDGEAGGDDTSPVWQPRPARRTGLEDDEGWLDAWAGEQQQQEAVGSPPLGTVASGVVEPDTAPAQDDPPAPADEPAPAPAAPADDIPVPADDVDIPEVSAPVSATQRSEDEPEE